MWTPFVNLEISEALLHPLAKKVGISASMPVRTSLARARLRTSRPQKIATSTRSSPPKKGNRGHQVSTGYKRINSESVDGSYVEPKSTLATSSSSDTHMSTPMIPDLYTSDPPIRDPLITRTSVVQDKIVDDCLPFLAAQIDGVSVNQFGVPHLDRSRHIRFLRKSLGKLPAPFIAADASRPWFLYWCLNGLYLLGEDVSTYRHGVIETARLLQNGTGGFGGGFGQDSHLATTYAMVLALAIVGGESSYEVVDRRAMWKWLSSLKQQDGGFQMALGGEVDVR